MPTATISFTNAADIETAIGIVGLVDPTAKIHLPRNPDGLYVEFEIATSDVGQRIETYVHNANDQGSGPFAYQVCVPV